MGQEAVEFRDLGMLQDRLTVDCALLLELSLGSEDIAELSDGGDFFEGFLVRQPQSFTKGRDGFVWLCCGSQEGGANLQVNVSTFRQECFPKDRRGGLDLSCFLKQRAKENTNCCVGVSDLFKDLDGLLRPSIQCQVITVFAECPIVSEFLAFGTLFALQPHGLPVFLD